MDDLKPCPFCGSKDVVVVNGLGYFVGCISSSCWARGPEAKTLNKAVELWNACLGIPTPALESGAVRELVEVPEEIEKKAYISYMTRWLKKATAKGSALRSVWGVDPAKERSWSWADVVAPIKPPKPKPAPKDPPRLKVGDRVKKVHGGGIIPKGTLGTIEKIGSHGHYGVTWDGEKGTYYYGSVGLELAPDPPFKRGDRVRATGFHDGMRINNGQICHVKTVRPSKTFDYTVKVKESPHPYDHRRFEPAPELPTYKCLNCGERHEAVCFVDVERRLRAAEDKIRSKEEPMSQWIYDERLRREREMAPYTDHEYEEKLRPCPDPPLSPPENE